MQIGNLDKFVKVRAWVDVPNGSASLDQTYSAGIDRWASIQPVGSAAYFGAIQVGEEVTDRMFFRFEPGTLPQDITTKHVIDFGGERYRVRRSTNWRGQSRWTAVDVENLGVIQP